MKWIYLFVLLMVMLLTPLTAEELILQPDGDVGKDAMVSSYDWDGNHGDAEELLLDRG